MKKEINLLPQLVEESEREKKLKKILSIGSPIALVLYGILLVIIYIYWNIQVTGATEIKDKISNTQNTITTQKETESMYRGVKAKLGGVSIILNGHLNYATVLSHIEQIIPGEISLTSLNIKEDGTIEISLQSPNSALLTTFINSLLDQNVGGKYFSHASLTSLVLSKDGSYLFSLNFHLNQGT